MGFSRQVLFQIALATLDANRSKLLAVEDDGEAMTVLGHYLEGVTNRDSTVKIPGQQISNRSVGVPQVGVSASTVSDILELLLITRRGYRLLFNWETLELLGKSNK